MVLLRLGNVIIMGQLYDEVSQTIVSCWDVELVPWFQL